ncbi:MAG: DUF4097 family beta strand repeat-containing protein [Gemmatimonadota bacterium]
MQTTVLQRGRAVALAVLLGAPLLAPTPLLAQRSETVFSDGVGPASVVRLATATGEIEVERAAGETLEVTGIAHEDNSDIEFEVLREGDELIICALRVGIDRCTDDGVDSRRSRRDDRSRGDLIVLLPDGIDLIAASGNGDVRVADAGADVVAASGNGSVLVEVAAGHVHASSGNGRVTVSGAGGPVEASSGNGRVVVSTALGPVHASSGNGDLEIDIASLEGAGDLEFSSGNGRIELTVPADFSADLEANLGNGEVESDFPLTVEGRLDRHRVRARIGEGGRRLRVSSGNGDLVLRRR